MVLTVHKAGNHDEALRQETASGIGAPSVPPPRRGTEPGRVLPSALPGQAPSPPVPQFPWQEPTLAMRMATWGVLLSIGTQKGAGVGNRWNSWSHRKGWQQQSHRLRGNRRVALFTSSFIF